MNRLKAAHFNLLRCLLTNTKCEKHFRHALRRAFCSGWVFISDKLLIELLMYITHMQLGSQYSLKILWVHLHKNVCHRGCSLEGPWGGHLACSLPLCVQSFKYQLIKILQRMRSLKERRHPLS